MVGLVFAVVLLFGYLAITTDFFIERAICMARQRSQRFYGSTRTRMVSCRTYILRMKMGALRLENAHQLF
jgi:hypothetical protein